MQYKVKGIFLICLLAMGYLAHSQVPTAVPVLYNSKIYQFSQYIQNDSGFFSARRDTNFTPKQGGCVVFKTSDSTLYVSTGKFTGRKWKGIGSGGGTGVYNAGYGLALSVGTFRVDTSLISTVANALYLSNLKLNKSDTASMLLPYLRRFDTTAMLSKYLRKADTATLSNRINLKLNIGDTSNMLLPYLRKADTTAMLSSYIKDAGYGLIKNTQSLITDTFKLATRPYLHGRLDSLGVVNSFLFAPFYSNVRTVADVNYDFNTDPDGYKWNYIIFSANSTNTRTINLPSSSSNAGRVITLISTDGAFKRNFVLAGSDTIIDLTGASVGFLDYASTVTIVAISTGWLIFLKQI